MATISSSNFLTLADNVAKTISDINTTFITNPANNAPTIATITGGLNGASNSLQAHLAALADFSQELALESGASTAVTNVLALLNNQITLNSIYAQYAAFMNALENATSGVNAFLTTNTAQVQQHFANAYNYYAANAPGLGLKSPAPTAIVPANIFPAAVQTPIATINVTGSAAGTYVAGTAIDVTKYATLPIYVYNNSVGNAAASTAFSVTYTGADGNPHTTTVNISSGMQTGIGNGVTASITGSAVTNITVTSNGTNTESYIFYAPIVRAVAY